MIYSEFRNHLGKAGITITDFATYRCFRPSTVPERAKTGEVPHIYATLAVQMGETVRQDVSDDDLFARYGGVLQAAQKSNTRQLNRLLVIKNRS